MTREEAIKFWKFRYESARVFSDPHWEAQERREHREYVEALRMAIEALQGDMYCPNCGVRLVPEAEYLEPTHTHGRLIDAEALVRSIRLDISITGKENAETVSNALNEIMAKIADAPTVQADRPNGEWIVEYTDANGDKWYRCSHCGERFVLIEKGEASTEPYHFCPNCGADMRGERYEKTNDE